jgi:hypothetical protein
VTPAVVPATGNTYQVFFHPDGGLYVGDLVSLEVVDPRGNPGKEHTLRVQVDGTSGKTLGPAKFEPYGIAGRVQATMFWAWDTHGLQAGQHKLVFSIAPTGETWTQTVILQPASALPPPEPQAHWASATSACCVINYITGTEAERDIAQLLKEADAQARDASSKFGINFSEPITITLLPRVLGNGGFTNNEISISYLDRNYSANRFDIVLHHEMIHILDGRLGGDLRPSLLVEGLAVYLTGGHYKPENLMQRAGALLQLPGSAPGQGQGWYIPLRSLADAFYASQHEIGYIEGGAIIEFMVKTWGWDKFSAFYRDIHQQPDNSQASAIDAALQKHFQLSLSELEKRFIQALESQDIPPAVLDDVRLSTTYFDTMRRYQQLLDPSAYFRTAWLLDNAQMRKRGIVADYLRHPATPENLAIEPLLIAANGDLNTGKYQEAEKLLVAINHELDEVAQETAVDTAQ